MAHKKSSKTGHLEYAWSVSGLTWAEARGLEQLGILAYNAIDFGLNSINGISSENPNRYPYLHAAWNYVYNQVTNEYYNIVGQ